MSSRDRKFSPIPYLAMGVVLALVGLPVGVIVLEAFGQGLKAYTSALASPETLDAVRLSLKVTLGVVGLNTLFGLAIVYGMGRGPFPGRRILMAIVELPLTVSPVVAGLACILLFGKTGLWGPWLQAHGVSFVFTPLGVGFATLFVTVPFVARELLAVHATLEQDEEEAARLLGANEFQTFVRVTLPRLRGALFYAVVLCTARAMGEFGAASVVSGHIAGSTVTLPLHIETLYSDYEFSSAFAVSTLLLSVGLFTLVVKRAVLKDNREAHRSPIRARRFPSKAERRDTWRGQGWRASSFRVMPVQFETGEASTRDNERTEGFQDLPATIQTAPSGTNATRANQKPPLEVSGHD